MSFVRFPAGVSTWLERRDHFNAEWVDTELILIEEYILALTPPGGGVVSVNAGTDITITGSPTTPIVNVTAGSFDAFGAASAALAVAEAYTNAQVAPLAPINSPNFTGTPTAPTAPPSTNNTQIATTAFVETAISGLNPASYSAVVGDGINTEFVLSHPLATTDLVASVFETTGQKRQALVCSRTISAGQFAVQFSNPPPANSYAVTLVA